MSESRTQHRDTDVLDRRPDRVHRSGRFGRAPSCGSNPQQTARALFGTTERPLLSRDAPQACSLRHSSP